MSDMSNDLWVPDGLSDRTAERWSKAVGEAGRRWFKGVGGPLMTRVSSDVRFLQAANLAESPVLLGFSYARWNEINAWAFGVDEGHPFIIRKGKPPAGRDELEQKFGERVCIQAKMIDAVDGAGLPEDGETKPVDRSYLLFGSSRERLLYHAETAPTLFCLGAVLGWIALGDWHHEIYGEAGRPGYRVVA